MVSPKVGWSCRCALGSTLPSDPKKTQLKRGLRAFATFDLWAGKVTVIWLMSSAGLCPVARAWCGLPEHLEEEWEETQHALMAVGLLEMCRLGGGVPSQQDLLSWTERDMLKGMATHPLKKNNSTLLLAVCSLWFKHVPVKCGRIWISGGNGLEWHIERGLARRENQAKGRWPKPWTDRCSSSERLSSLPKPYWV